MRDPSINDTICQLFTRYEALKESEKSVNVTLESILVSISYYVSVFIVREPSFLSLFYNVATAVNQPKFPLMTGILLFHSRLMMYGALIHFFCFYSHFTQLIQKWSPRENIARQLLSIDVTSKRTQSLNAIYCLYVRLLSDCRYRSQRSFFRFKKRATQRSGRSGHVVLT